MEQFRQIGEAIGSMRAMMVFKDTISINRRQCCLLLDIFTAAYLSISQEMNDNLRFQEKHTPKWKVLEQPLRDLLSVVREADLFIRTCLEPNDWWAKALSLSQNRDCVELHIHNLLSCLPSVIEAIEMAGEISGWSEDEMSKKRLVHSNKYMIQWKDPQMFKWKFGKQYLVSSDFCCRFESAWSEDRWILINKLQEKKKKKNSGSGKNHDTRLADFLLKNLENGHENLNSPRLLPYSLLKTKDYQVKRRLGNGGQGQGQYKEITWLGENFALRQFYGDMEALLPEVSQLLSLSHPHIENSLCGFTDEESKECFLIMELMSRTLCTHVKEVYGLRKKNTVSLPAAVDLMLQIARGMEYLHSKRIYHGELNPSNILVKPKGNNTHPGDAHYLHARISGFGLNSVKGFSHKAAPSGQNESFPFIWYAPEVLEEQEQSGTAGTLKYTDKSDVYSFGMICFELLTGKVPFEDSHLQGEKMSRNIRAGERPLFPFHSPKYVTNLTKRCWHTDPNQRPSFSSICRILRYIKRFLALNPEGHSSQQDTPFAPGVDYHEIETKLSQKLSWESTDIPAVSQIPFQMFAYRVVEREKTSSTSDPRDNSESGSDRTSLSGDENGAAPDDQVPSIIERRLSSSNEVGISKKRPSPLLKRTGLKPIQELGKIIKNNKMKPKSCLCYLSLSQHFLLVLHFWQ
ncbi:PREDICTED: mitogen-activated protein kinase kinase kinase 7 [Tarenaya hassleriana]|uniref:mitogen-activated protein kinase kinase kinase 7 n=1 Tax=Tarenaya hassleriana TaxID=28532 RepID=UPI0008FD3284|nr:PREDICTED: mitogen-activated protein kinase kinase kinase 7 [Tarenaya hassleriana]